MWFNLQAMAKVCEFCGKGYLKGNQVPRGVGRRVTRRTVIHQEPNLRIKTMEVNGTPTRVRLCTSCLKRIRYESALAEKEQVKA
jgi:large subunit ribosomal protein L28